MLDVEARDSARSLVLLALGRVRDVLDVLAGVGGERHVGWGSF